MQLLSKAAAANFPLLNSGFFLLAPKLNGIGRITIKQQCPKFLIPLAHRLSTLSTTPKNRNVVSFSKKEMGRLFSSTFKTTPFATPKTVARFHATDGLSPKSFTLIYKSDFQWYLVVAQTTVLLAIGAILVCFGTYLIDIQMPRDDPEAKAEIAARILQSEKVARNELKVETGRMEATGPEVIENLPSMADAISEDLDVIGIFLMMLVMLGLSVFRLMRMLPLRIYVGKKNHCIGVYYGSLIPGKLVRQEFVAGTVTLQKSSLGIDNAYFKDGSGRGMMLFERFFRRPADFNYLTGITKSFDLDDEDSTELSQLKRIGSYGSSDPKT